MPENRYLVSDRRSPKGVAPSPNQLVKGWVRRCSTIQERNERPRHFALCAVPSVNARITSTRVFARMKRGLEIRATLAANRGLGLDCLLLLLLQLARRLAGPKTNCSAVRPILKKDSELLTGKGRGESSHFSDTKDHPGTLHTRAAASWLSTSLLTLCQMVSLTPFLFLRCRWTGSLSKTLPGSGMIAGVVIGCSCLPDYLTFTPAASP